MNASRILSYVIVALAAGAGGYFAGRPGDNQGSSGNRLKPENARVENAHGSGGFIPAAVAKIIGDTPPTADTAKSITFRALETSDPVNRMAAVALLVESMTPENAPAIYQGFLDITTKTGRKHDGEWALMLKRYGEVMGAACFKQLQSEPFNLALAIEGWATVDPEGVVKSLKEAKVQDSRFDTALLTGICRKDPANALAMALSGGYATLDGNAIITQAIHTSGLDGAQAALQKALDPHAGENITGSPVFQKIFGAFTDAMFHKNWTDGTPEPMLKWLEQQKDQSYITPAILEHAVHDAVIKGDPAAAADWLARMNEGRTGEVAGGRGIFLAVFETPSVLEKMDDATFNRILPMLPKYASESFNALATMIERTNPARADQLRLAAPPQVPADSVPAPTPP
jgi:hypothetical protein